MVAFEGENVILHWYFFKKNFTKKYDDIYDTKTAQSLLRTNYIYSIVLSQKRKEKRR